MKTIRENKIARYIAYGLGEILLVTIGILIAVSINNINEKTKQAKQLTSIYNTIENELALDSINLSELVSWHEQVDTIMSDVLEGKYKGFSLDTINQENYSDNPALNALYSSYDPFSPNTNGYKSLLRFDNNSDGQQDSLTFKVIQFYATRLDLLDDILGFISDTAVENLKSLEKHPWYSDFANGKYNRAASEYFLSDQNYFNKLSTYKLLIIDNYLDSLKEYDLERGILLQELRKR